MNTPVAKIKLAPGNIGFYDSYTGINLTLNSPEALVYNNYETRGIRNAIKAGKIRLLGGSLPSSNLNIKKKEPILKGVKTRKEKQVKKEEIKREEVKPSTAKTQAKPVNAIKEQPKPATNPVATKPVSTPATTTAAKDNKSAEKDKAEKKDK